MPSAYADGKESVRPRARAAIGCHSSPDALSPALTTSICSADTNRIAPPKYRKGSMRIVPLGGLGEIGRNMNVIEYNGHILLIDCGVLFPEEEQPGVDLILG